MARARLIGCSGTSAARPLPSLGAALDSVEGRPVSCSDRFGAVVKVMQGHVASCLIECAGQNSFYSGRNHRSSHAKPGGKLAVTLLQ